MSKTKKPQNTKAQEPVESIESTLGKAESFIQKHQKTISYVVGGIVLIVLLALAYNKFIRQPKEKAAHEQMFMAEYYFSVDSLELALYGDGTNSGFYDIIDDYKWTSASRLANYYVGMILMEQGQFDEAISHLKKFKSKDEILSAMANGAIGDAYVELGDYDKALRYYLRAANKRPNAFVSPTFLTKAAWVHEQNGDFQKAIELYEKIKTDFHQSTESREADKNIAFLEAKLNKD